MKTTITRDEWLVALGKAAEPVDPDSMTVTELAEKYQVGRSAMEDIVQRLEREGRVTRTRKFVTYGSGQRRTQTAYRLLPIRKDRRA